MPSLWNTVWEEQKHNSHWQKPAEVVIELMERYDLGEGAKVLDLGCGIGRHALLFAANGATVTALDESPKAIEELRKQADRLNLEIEIITDDYLAHSFVEPFDCIISYNVIYHGDYAHFKKSIDLCHDLLAEDGLFFFTCPTRQDAKYGDGIEVSEHAYKSSTKSLHPGEVHYFADKQTLEDLLADFTILSIHKDEHYWEHDGHTQLGSNWQVIAQKNNLPVVGRTVID